jgi:hypothetical protein
MRRERTSANRREHRSESTSWGSLVRAQHRPSQEALLVQRSVVEPPNAPKAAGVVVVMVTGGGPALSAVVG